MAPSSKPEKVDFTHQGACVVRTPLLPFEILQGGGDLRRLLEDPVVREALFVASPSLDAGIDAWLADPNAPRARDVALIVARYVARMAARPTPFGLFSGCAAAIIGPTTELAVSPARECQRSSRLDMQYLALLAEALERDPEVRNALRFRPNSSIVLSGDELRYVEPHGDPAQRARLFRLVSVEPMPALLTALRAAESSATAAELRDAIVRTQPEVEPEEAQAFVEDLVAARLLESNLQPSVTGDDPLASFTRALEAEEATRPIGERLANVHRALGEIDAHGPGANREAYRAIMAMLEPLPVPLDPARLFQVDLFKPNPELRVGERVVGEVVRAVNLLHRITPRRPSPAMKRFRERFVERYGNREIPLEEALDEERGLGFGRRGNETADPSPLLADLAMPEPPEEDAVLGAHDKHKLQRLLSISASRARVWALDDADIEALSAEDRAPLPDAIGAMITVAAKPGAAIDRGDFELLVHNIFGPSGALLLGRFCHGDRGVRALVDRHLRAEEALRPGAIFAEIVHLPEGRLGNILCRPVLRSHEIPFLGVSEAPADRQLPLDDLRVRVQGGAVRLRSARLDREVVPRLTAAHNYANASLAVYRFLCALQHEGGGLRWSWGPFDDAPFLPRVTRGRVVLSLARWTLTTEQIERAAREPDSLSAHGLPRWVCAVEHDNVLPLDLERDGIAQLVALTRSKPRVRLQELYPGPELLCAQGEGGKYAHEMVIPLVRVTKEEKKKREKIGRGSGKSEAVRSFPPGSSWLYTKIYTGPTTADHVLRDTIGPLVRELREEGIIAGWFFIRYADPDTHLRARFRGEAGVLLERVLPRLHRMLGPRLANRSVGRLQADTYEQEVERYGGARAMLVAERIFEADSDAILRVLESIEAGAMADARWRMILVGVHTMLEDARLEPGARITLVERAREAYLAEHRMNATSKRSLGARYRTERSAIMPIVSSAHAASAEVRAWLEPAREIMAARSRILVPAFEELRALQGEPDFETTWEDLLRSFVHMHVIRAFREDQRTHEMVLYDFLARAYDSLGQDTKDEFSARAPAQKTVTDRSPGESS